MTDGEGRAVQDHTAYEKQVFDAFAQLYLAHIQNAEHNEVLQKTCAEVDDLVRKDRFADSF